MAKKSFTEGINVLLGQKPEQKKDNVVDEEKSIKQQHSTIRATFIVNKEMHNSIKAIAYWERLRIQDVVNNAFSKHIDEYEKIKGKLKKPCDK